MHPDPLQPRGTREFIVLPADAVDRADDVRDYLLSQRSRSATEDDHVLCLNAALEGWNNKVAPDAVVRWIIAGDAVQVWMPEHVASQSLLPWIAKDVARPDAAWYDAAANTLVPLSKRHFASVDIGGEVARPSVTLDELHEWVPRLHRLASTPFLIVAKPEDRDTFIQTYRGSPLEPDRENPSYALEVADGPSGRLYATELDDPAEVADLMWDWVEDRWSGLYRLSWQCDGPSGMQSVSSLREALNRSDRM